MKRWRLLCTLLQWLIFIIHFKLKFLINGIHKIYSSFETRGDVSLIVIGYR